MTIIYGAGDYGKRLYTLLSQSQIEVDYFCLTKKTDRKEYCGLPLICLEDLARFDQVDHVFVAVSDHGTSRVLMENILDQCPNVRNILEMGDFIKRNLTQEKAVPIHYKKNNVYEEGLAVSYWKAFFLDKDKLTLASESLKKGMAPDDIEQIDSIIGKMKALPLEEEERDLFSSSEKTRIRKQEREFTPGMTEEKDSGERYLTWGGWRCFADCNMSAAVWYYRCGINALKNLARLKDRAIIDAGAYIGDSAVVLSEYTRGNVYAFEPLSTNYERIMELCRINRVRNVVPVNKALSSSSGVAKLYISENLVGSGIVRRSSIVYEHEVSANTITLDEFVEKNNITIGLIKADIEGGELDMLKGARKTISEQRPAMLISIYHTAEDFFGIKQYLEENHPYYEFRIFQPFARDRIIRDTMLVCECSKMR